MHKAMWWAQQSGMFPHQQQLEFHELLRMLQVHRTLRLQWCAARA